MPTYGKVGTSRFRKSNESPGDGWVEMNVARRPSADAIVQEDGTWLTPLKERCLKAIKAKAASVYEGGIEKDGVVIQCTPENMASFAEINDFFTLNPSLTTDFCVNGQSVHFTKSTFDDFYGLALELRQSGCYAKRAALTTALDSKTDEELAAYNIDVEWEALPDG